MNPIRTLPDCDRPGRTEYRQLVDEIQERVETELVAHPETGARISVIKSRTPVQTTHEVAFAAKEPDGSHSLIVRGGNVHGWVSAALLESMVDQYREARAAGVFN